jgi:type VI secretion system protein VasG
MAAISSAKSLVAKLNSTCRKGLEAALGLVVARTHYNVEIEHWLVKLLEPANTDLSKILKHYDINPAQVTRELTKTIDGFNAGNARKPEMSADILTLWQESWSMTSLEYGAFKIRTGYMLAALLSDRTFYGRMRASSPELTKIPAQKLVQEVKAIIAGSVEDEAETAGAPAGEAGPGGPTVAADSKTPNLDQFTMNLTERAKKGEIDPVIGRDFEIRQVIDILTRRRQNNPILAGEAGVGKTAVVEGFALKIVAGEVPDALKKVHLRTLDLGLLQAGASAKGVFEERLKGVIAEVKASPIPIILFIDEAHTLIGAGGSGAGDAANLLKPALARGELRTVAATTWAEYKKYFETDAAMKRRFQVVKVDEPDVVKAINMMRGLTGMLEKHHKVRILPEAVEDSVKLSHRYITDRQLPDKSISLLDTACAKVALGQATVPAQVEDLRRQIEYIDVELGILARETAVGTDASERVKEITELKETHKKSLEILEKRWNEEKKIVADIQAIRAKLEGHLDSQKPGSDGKGKLTPAEETQGRNQLVQLDKQLREIQGQTPLVLPTVNSQAVADIVSGWTGIPVGKMVVDEIQTILNLADKLKERVVGQNHGLEAIAQRIRTSRANLTDPRRPIGVFMLVGPSGVGKTETAMALADILYGGEKSMIIVNMSEYKESHKISRLTGSAAGYVGYGEGGVLTEGVRRKPYSIVLLDEVEKSHPDVQEVFYQVFDKGTLQDDKGNDINFKNTIIILTSNVGTDTIMKLCADPDTAPDEKGLAEALRPDLLKVFKPALLGRMTIVPYFPLGDEVLKNIIKLKIKAIGDRVRNNYKAQFSYDDAVIKAVADRCTEVESGARNVDNILTGTMLPEISQEFLSYMAEGKTITSLHVGLNPEGGFKYEIK